MVLKKFFEKFFLSSSSSSAFLRRYNRLTRPQFLNTMETSQEEPGNSNSSTSHTQPVANDQMQNSHEKATQSDFNIQHQHNTLIFKNPDHSNKVLNNFDEMRKQNLACDVVLVVNDHEIRCHKVVLAANSSYFLAMFSNGLLETNQSRVQLKQVDAESMQILVDFMYTGKVLITEQNVQQMLITANLLGMVNIKDSCAQFIQAQLDITNCLGIRDFADIHSCQILKKHADAFIDRYFREIVQRDEFLDLEADQLQRIISRDHLTVNSEKEIFESVLKWLNHNSSRSIFFGRVMQHVRFGLLSYEELQSISENVIFRKNIVCREFVAEALHYVMVKTNPDELKNCISEFNPARITPRLPMDLPKVMLIFGGQSPKAISKIDIYDFNLQKWRLGDVMPWERCRAGCVYYENLIYLVGGFNGQSRSRSVEIFNPKSREWSEGPEMICRRGTLGIGLVNDCIYAVGGFDGVSGLNSVEKWDIKSSQSWVFVQPMITRRSSLGVTVLNGFIYAVGGYCGLTKECLRSVERYDPCSDKWTMVANMNERRSGSSVVSFDGRIYVAGGHDRPQVLRSAEVYDPLVNQWTAIADLNIARRNSGMVVNNGQIYVIGGDDGQVNLSSAEVMAQYSNRVWCLLPNFLANAKSHMSIVTIEDYQD